MVAINRMVYAGLDVLFDTVFETCGRGLDPMAILIRVSITSNIKGIINLEVFSDDVTEDITGGTHCASPARRGLVETVLSMAL